MCLLHCISSAEYMYSRVHVYVLCNPHQLAPVLFDMYRLPHLMPTVLPSAYIFYQSSSSTRTCNATSPTDHFGRQLWGICGSHQWLAFTSKMRKQRRRAFLHLEHGWGLGTIASRRCSKHDLAKRRTVIHQ